MSAGDPTDGAPWWASGRDPAEGLDGTEDPVDAHRDARRGGAPPPGDADEAGADVSRLASDAIDLVARLAAEAGRRVASRAASNASGPTTGSFTRPDAPDADGPGPRADGPGPHADDLGPHPDGRVCDACPVCIGLRALRQVRPEVIGHLSEAAHHVSLALRAFADAQAGGTDDLEKIDLDP